MIIFYCVLLVIVLFFIFMEIVTYPANKLPFDNSYQTSHIIHILAYIIAFICICFLLRYELYM